MPRNYTLADLQAAAPRVLERLRALAPLPDYGTVAGQSVASLFWEELGHAARGPVNDIDVFVNCNLPRSMRGLEEFPADRQFQNSTKVQTTTTHLADIGVDNSSYEHVKFIALRATTMIMRTYQVGLLNYTLVKSPFIAPGDLGHSAQVSSGLIEGFDLNIVSVGINLQSGEVVASQGFLDFLQDGKIKVETCNTPAHTLVRLAKKVFGGEITQATCDYASERQMLEVALACQSKSQEPDTSSSVFHAILRFGGGKYKALYDRFAAVLPPIREEKATLTDGSEYAFYVLAPPAPTHAHDIALLQGVSGPDVLQDCVGQTIYVSHFPRIYDLFHPERSSLPADELARRRALFEQLDPSAKSPHNFRCLQGALGAPVVDQPVENMAEEDAAVFFFNQDCAKSPDRTRAAANAWAALPTGDRTLAQSLSLRADAVLALYQDREATWKSLLQEHGVLAVQSACNRYLAGRGGENRPLVRQILAWMTEMGPAGQRLAHQLLPCDDEYGGHVGYFSDIVRTFEGPERLQVATDFIRRVFPSWPVLDEEPGPIRTRAMLQWASTRLPIPMEFWDIVPPSGLPGCVEGLCKSLLTGPGSRADRLPAFEAAMAQVLPRLSSEHLAANNGRLVRALLCLDAGDLAHQTLVDHPASEQVDEMLSHLIVAMHTKPLHRPLDLNVFGPTPSPVVQDPDDILEDFGTAKDEWCHLSDNQQLTSMMEQALLLRKSKALAAAPVLRRAPRL